MSGQQIGKRFLKIMSSNLLGWVCLTGSCWAQKPTCQGQPPVKENLTCVEAESDQTSTDQPTTGGAALLLPQDKPQPESSTIENWFKPVFELSTEPPSLETVSEGATTEEVNLVPSRPHQPNPSRNAPDATPKLVNFSWSAPNVATNSWEGTATSRKTAFWRNLGNC